MKRDSSIDRRHFIGGAGILAAGTALSGILSGCTPNANGSAGAEENAASETDVVAAAEPIAPVEAPEQWDYEADVVVVGTGGGGLVATLYAAQNNERVIAVEKQGVTGGATRHAAWFGAGSPWLAGVDAEFDPIAETNTLQTHHQYSIDNKLSINMINAGAECMTWLTAQDNIPLELEPLYLGVWLEPEVKSGAKYNVMGLSNAMKAIEDNALKAGAEIIVNTACETLVVEDGRVIGIKAIELNGNEIYIKGEKGVILCAGGFGMNRALLKRYIPSAYKAAATGGPMPWHTGEAFRMGLGVGADYSGFNSFSVWEGGIDSYDYSEDDTEMKWHYFWWGPRQLLTNAWLRLDKQCNRIPYYATEQEDFKCSYSTIGELSSGIACMNSVGQRGYVVLDANYEENIEQLIDRTMPDQTRLPIEDASKLNEAAVSDGLVTADWKQEVRDAINQGIIKRADTLEELAEEVGLEPNAFVAAVERWNEICEQGEDADLPIPYFDKWLLPIENPPYYCAKMSGFIGKTMCGLRVDENAHVIDSDGNQIPGLYAGWSTAGGFAGENNYGTQWYNTSPYGASALTACSGYLACKSLLAAK